MLRNMATEFGLSLEQSQKLVMTNQLQLAIQLLQMSSLEVEQLLVEELQTNPFLNEKDIDPERYDQPSSDYSYSSASDPENNFIENTYADEKDLRQFLCEQANIAFEDPHDKYIALTLIDYLEPSGYFATDLIEIESETNQPLEKIEAVLIKLKSFEPSGIFAKNLAECLTTQLQDQGLYNPQIAILIDHLHLLAGKEYKKLETLCKVETQTLAEMISLVQSLQPKPADGYDTQDNNAVTPDIFIQHHPTEGWSFELKYDWLGKIYVDQGLYEEIKAVGSKDEQKFIQENFKQADWIMRAVKQRDMTLLKVTQAIFEKQKAFFEKGVSHLKPMTLKDIAETVDLHESTVSRITTNKYLNCKYGTFELKYFFTAALNRLYKTQFMNEDHSAESIRHKIQTLITDEDPKNILSDEALSALLSEEGIEIARRTVAKYREALNIPTSAQRKRDAKSKLYFAG